MTQEQKNPDPKVEETTTERETQLVQYFTCHLCYEHIMILTMPDVCDHCGHEQCEECVEWGQHEDVKYWIEKV